MVRILVPRSAISSHRILVLTGSQEDGLGLAETTSVDMAAGRRHGPEVVGSQFLLAFLAELISELTGAAEDVLLPRDGSAHQREAEDVPGGIPQVHGEVLEAPNVHHPICERAARRGVEGSRAVAQAVRCLDQLSLLDVEPLKQRKKKIGPHPCVGLPKSMVRAERLDLPKIQKIQIS